MKPKQIFLLLCLSLTFIISSAQNTDSLTVEMCIDADTMALTMTTCYPKYQMSFLMQGVIVNICDTNCNRIVGIRFPDASMVRDRLPRHPNEVKATLVDGNQREIRPDLQPLISAHNTLHAQIIDNDSVVDKYALQIKLHNESGLITFAVRFHLCYCGVQDSICLEIVSLPMGNGKEYNGKILSSNNNLRSGGLGSAPLYPNDNSRMITMRKIIKTKQTTTSNNTN